MLSRIQDWPWSIQDSTLVSSMFILQVPALCYNWKCTLEGANSFAVAVSNAVNIFGLGHKVKSINSSGHDNCELGMRDGGRRKHV